MIQMANTKEKQAPYGNPQLNIRLEKEILDQLKAAAEKEGMSAQDWARRAILTSLGQDIPGGIGRAEFEDAIAPLNLQIKRLQGLIFNLPIDLEIENERPFFTLDERVKYLEIEVTELKKLDGIE